MREGIGLYRGKRKDNGEWVCGGFHSRFGRAFIIGISKKLRIDGIEVDPETVGLFTGLYDSTKWEELLEEEKVHFYYENYSEDGETIKYPNVESIKRLWKGKRIFEGDIVKVERDLWHGENKKEREIFNGVVWYDEEHACFGIKSEKYRCLPMRRFKGDYQTVIGNIHDNSELLQNT